MVVGLAGPWPAVVIVHPWTTFVSACRSDSTPHYCGHVCAVVCRNGLCISGRCVCAESWLCDNCALTLTDLQYGVKCDAAQTGGGACNSDADCQFTRPIPPPPPAQADMLNALPRSLSRGLSPSLPPFVILLFCPHPLAVVPLVTRSPNVPGPGNNGRCLKNGGIPAFCACNAGYSCARCTARSLDLGKGTAHCNDAARVAGGTPLV